MSTLYRGPSIDASYQVLVHLAEGFQRRRLKCEVNGRREGLMAESLDKEKVYRTFIMIVSSFPVLV
jgi:hypothetical protein